MSDAYNDARLGVGTIGYESEAPRVQPAPHTYTATPFYETTRSDYYRVDLVSTSGDPATVAIHKRSGHIRCGTCLTANLCTHVAALREWLADQARVA